MLTEISEQQWNDLRKGKGGDSIFCDPLFIHTVAAVYGVKPAFYSWQENGQFILGFAAYLRNRRIVHPNYVFYSGFIYDAGRDPVFLAGVFNALTDHLKSRFLSAYWKTGVTAAIDPSVIRPAYIISERKTYIKQLDDLTYKQDVHRRIRIAEKNGVVLTADRDAAAGLDWHCQEFAVKYHKSKRFVRESRALFRRLEEQQMISYYHAYFEEKLTASALIVKDEPHKTAYLWYLTSDPAFHKLGAHAALYDFFFRDLKEKGYAQVDLCGANMPGIAAYKATFLPDLHTYHELGYTDFSARLIKEVKRRIKILLGIKS